MPEEIGGVDDAFWVVAGDNRDVSDAASGHHVQRHGDAILAVQNQRLRSHNLSASDSVMILVCTCDFLHYVPASDDSHQLAAIQYQNCVGVGPLHLAKCKAHRICWAKLNCGPKINRRQGIMDEVRRFVLSLIQTI